MPGFGFSPAGTSPAGVGLPVTSPALVDAGFSQSTTGAVSSLNIDSESRDFTVDSLGSEEGMSDTAQRVFLCMRTLRGIRPTFANFGFKGPPKITDDVRTQVKEAVRLALQPVLTDGSAELQSVETESEGTRIFALIKWRDTRRGTTTTTRKALTNG